MFFGDKKRLGGLVLLAGLKAKMQEPKEEESPEDELLETVAEDVFFALKAESPERFKKYLKQFIEICLTYREQS